MIVTIERPLPYAVLSACVGFLVYRFIIQPVFLSPLARIPKAHWSAPLAPLWILYVRYSRKENTTLHAAHQKFGPIVRIGPHELSIDKIDNVRTVYQGGFEKSNFYSIFDNYGYVVSRSSHGPLVQILIYEVRAMVVDGPISVSPACFLP